MPLEEPAKFTKSPRRGTARDFEREIGQVASFSGAILRKLANALSVIDSVRGIVRRAAQGWQSSSWHTG